MVESSFVINETDVIKDLDIFEKGGQGIINIGYYNKSKVIIKTISKGEYIEKELQAYITLSHDYMVHFHGYYFDNYGNINLVLDFAEGATLTEKILDDKLNYQQKLNIIEKLTIFLIYLREKHAIHRDLKPDNIKVKVINDTEVEIKVLDFGITKLANKSVDFTKMKEGTLSYTPPEVFGFEESDLVEVSFKYDIWSLGMIISYLFSGSTPWKTDKKKINNFLLYIESQLIDKKPFPVPGKLDHNIKTVVELCTNVDPIKRINPLTVLTLIKLIKSKKEVSEYVLTSDNYK